jgi:WD40 repeat protein
MLILRLSAAVALCVVFVASAADPKPSVVYTGHTDPVYAVTVSPDGSLVATGSFDKSIKLWDATSGKVVRTLAGPKGHESLVLSVAFDPTGGMIASGGADNTARLWDVPARKPMKEFPLGSAVRKVIVSPDGKMIAAGGADGRIRLWPTAEAGKPVELTGHTDSLNDLAFIGNGQQLVSVAADRTMRFWNTVNGEMNALVGVGPTAADGVVVYPNIVVTNGADGVIRLWTPPPPRAKAIAADATRFALSSTDAKSVLIADKSGVRVLSAQTLQQTKALAEAPTNATAVTFGSGIAAATEKGELVVWSSEGKLALRTTASTKPIRAVSFQSGKPVVLAAGDEGKVRLFAVPSKMAEKPAPVKPTVEFVADPAGVIAAEYDSAGRIVTAGASGEVKVWDAATGKEVRLLGKLPGRPTAFAVRRDGQQVAVVAGKSLKLWQCQDGKELPVPAQTSDVTSIAFHSDQSKLLVGSGKAVSVFDLQSGLVEQTVPHSADVTSVGLIGPAQLLVLGSDGKAVMQQLATVKVIKPESDTRGRPALVPNTNSFLLHGEKVPTTVRSSGNGNKERTLEPIGSARRVTYSANGDRLAVSREKPEIDLYSSNETRPIGTVKIPASMEALAFHPNGQSVVAALADKSVVAWNVVGQAGQTLPPEFGTAVQSFPHPAAVSTLAFVGDGSRLVTGSADGIVRMWKVAAEAPVKSFAHPNLVDAVAFDPTGTRLATGCHDGNLRIFDVAKAAQLKQIAAHTMPQPAPIYSVAWMPDGKSVVTASFDQSIKVWDATEGKLLTEIKPGTDSTPGHRDQVFTIAITADGKRIASGSSDRTVKLWELATGKLIRDFPNPDLPPTKTGPTPSHPGFVHAVRFAAKDTQLISVGTAPKGRGYLAVWSVGDGKKVAGSELPFGSLYSVAGFDNGDLLLGCGPAVRGQTESNAVRMPLPARIP